MTQETNTFIELIRTSDRKPTIRLEWCETCLKKTWHNITEDGNDEIHSCQDCPDCKVYTVR